jgi:hypothetical protein
MDESDLRDGVARLAAFRGQPVPSLNRQRA